MITSIVMQSEAHRNELLRQAAQQRKQQDLLQQARAASAAHSISVDFDGNTEVNPLPSIRVTNFDKRRAAPKLIPARKA